MNFKDFCKKAISIIVIMVALQPLSGQATEKKVTEKKVSVSSPDHKIKVMINVEGKTVSYQVIRENKPVIDPSRLGFRFKNIPHLDGKFIISNIERHTQDLTWELPWGERKNVRDHHNELRVTLTEKSDLKRRMIVTFRVFNDGIGFRYEIPKQKNLGDVEIIDELTEFRFSEEATAWWIPARGWNRYEYLYDATPVEEVTIAHTPMTLKSKSGLHISVHEAALVDYAAMTLKHGRDRLFKADLTPLSDGVRVKVKTPFKTPWRTIQLSENAGGLMMSDLILNLNEPNKLGDVSWVKPGKFVGVWWEMHLAKTTWGSGEKHGATTQNTKRYIDFAAEHGFDGVLVEGWNVGWDGDWYNNGDVFRFTEAYPDFDIKYLSEYAISKGVRLVGHHETSGGISNYEKQLGDALDYYKELGITSIKTGYVADGGDTTFTSEDGRVRHEWHDSQFMVRHYQKVIEEAAKRKISINTHEPIKDTGLRRTYPNWVSREGARAQEYDAWGSPGNTPEHTTILPFTRMLSGPMDYQPGIFDLLFEKEQPNNRIPTTLAKQLALYVVIYSPVQMVSDLPENYEARPKAFQFIKDVPTDWSETIVLNAEIGDYITVVRKDRQSEEWFLGSLSDEKARKFKVKLDFLTKGKTYRAEIYKDGKNADWQENPYEMAIESKQVTSETILSIDLATSGGQAIRFIPVK